MTDALPISRFPVPDLANMPEDIRNRILAEDPDLVPRLAGAGDDYELVFTSPPDASPAIECLSPELALPITATGAIETKAGVRLVDAARKRVPITASGWQHF